MSGRTVHKRAQKVGFREVEIAGSCPVPAVRAFLGADLGRRALVSVSRDHVVGGRATVTVRLPHTVAAPLFGGFTVQLEGHCTMRVER